VSVVRIPRPEEDAFPWIPVAVVATVGAAVGLGIAYWGMERDRPAEASLAPDSAEGTPDATRAEIEAPTEPVPEPIVEAEHATEPESAPAPVIEADEAGEAATEEAHTTPEPNTGPPSRVTPEPTSMPATSASGPLTLRTGRIAYLRCDGVPQRPGPFPCPRDEPLEQAVWAALRSVERCERSPGPGAADIVVDFETEQPTIRARDTFPADTVRTDAAALLACAGDSLENVRSSLSPRRLVVSFRLTLEAVAR
jgi:hypothetical protein